MKIFTIYFVIVIIIRNVCTVLHDNTAIKVDIFKQFHNMSTEKQKKQFTEAEDLTVTVEPSKEYEFLITTHLL